MNKQPTLKIDRHGTKRWYLNEKYHREDGPAIEWPNGEKYWYLNGKCHRINGPAIITGAGNKYWYLNGIRYNYDEWFQTLTSEQQYNYLWNFDDE